MTLEELIEALGLDADPATAEALTGGVSSEIWKLDTDRGPVVVKQACARLRVAGEWLAPIERSAQEARWLEVAAFIVPGFAPRVIASTPSGLGFAMEYLDATTHRVWKSDLLAGRVDPAVARSLGARLGVLHAATTGDPAIATRFDRPELFDALRLAPYLDATAAVHPDLAGCLAGLRAAYETHRTALVHGDVSPKNVLVGPDGPVLVDAECATWGDPAFDVAFVVTHLLLKRVHCPAARDGLDAAVTALVAAHRDALGEPSNVEARAAALTGGLLLARVDGLSPVEYLDDAARRRVRAAARSLVTDPPPDTATLTQRWAATTAHEANA